MQYEGDSCQAQLMCKRCYESVKQSSRSYLELNASLLASHNGEHFFLFLINVPKQPEKVCWYTITGNRLMHVVWSSYA